MEMKAKAEERTTYQSFKGVSLDAHTRPSQGLEDQQVRGMSRNLCLVTSWPLS